MDWDEAQVNEQVKRNKADIQPSRPNKIGQ